MRAVDGCRVLLIPLVAGCRNLVDIPAPGDPPPSIEGLLIAGSSATTFRLVWPDPISTESPTPRPVEPGQVALALVEESGPSAALLPRSDTVALFLVTLPIIAGHRYYLRGTIGDRTIAAVTTIPSSFTIEQPATDPIDATGPVPFRWVGIGASAFAADVAIFGRSGWTHTKNTSGSFNVRPGNSTLRLWAMNKDAENYLLNLQIPQSNITGGTGVLGGAILIERALQW